MTALTFEQARACVVQEVGNALQLPATEMAPLACAAGRILAEPVIADRDVPALPRSVRDGYAVRAADLQGALRVIGEVRAGERYTGAVGPGEAVEIMTGAPLPDGADAVVMVEHTTRDGEIMRTDRSAAPGDFINPRGCESPAGAAVIERGQRIDYTAVALLAAFGYTHVRVYRRIEVAILATGDEIVEVHERPLDHQIRNSNAQSLAAQIQRAGADARVLPVARDTREHTRELVEQGLASDLLLLSGGVSAGKYDVVEPVLAELGAKFFFDRVLIQPGQPLVFGRARDRFFFGLPGNPASTMVTFEIFARAAVERLSGLRHPQLAFSWARLTEPFRHRAGITRFLPAVLSGDGDLTPIRWSGSGDVPSMTRANCYLVTDPDKPEYAPGELIRVLAK